MPNSIVSAQETDELPVEIEEEKHSDTEIPSEINVDITVSETIISEIPGSNENDSFNDNSVDGEVLSGAENNDDTQTVPPVAGEEVSGSVKAEDISDPVNESNNQATVDEIKEIDETESDNFSSIDGSNEIVGEDNQNNEIVEEQDESLLESVVDEISSTDESVNSDNEIDETEQLKIMALQSQNVQNVSVQNEGDSADDLEYIDGVFYTRGTASSYGDIPVYYHYSDGYFRDRTEIDENGVEKENAFIYDESLCSASAAAATASWPTRFVSPEEDKKYENMSRNAQDLMRQLGFENIEINEAYHTEPVINGVMLIAGQKKVVYGDKEYTLIALFPDSGTKNPEWPMNVELGDGDYHEGFYYGATEVYLPYLRQYIEKNNISGDIKLWSASASRGAGVVNIAGGLLDLSIDDDVLSQYLPSRVSLDKKNIYIYTFGCPSTVSKDITWNKDESGNYTTRKDSFGNIHTLANAFDFVLNAVADDWDMDVFGDKTVISMHGDGVLTEEEFEKKLQEFGQQWVLMGGSDPHDLTYSRDYMTYDDETGFHYLPIEYRTSVTGDDMEHFAQRFMENIAPIVTREYYKAYLQPALEIFFGTSYESMGEMKAAISSETERLSEEIKVKVPELFWKGVRTLDFSELREYLNVYVNPLNALPQIVINAFKANGITYNYDFKNYGYSEDLLDDANMRKVLRQAGLKAGIGVFDLLSRLRLRDAVAALDVYQAMQAGFDTLSSGHDVALYGAWARVLDNTTLSNSDIYEKPMSEHDAWGYRMLNLPAEGNYKVSVYDDTEHNSDATLYQFSIQNGVVSDIMYSEDPDWFVHVGTGDQGLGKVLYLRPDHQYRVVFSSVNGTQKLGFSVDEWSSHYNYDVFEPVNHVIQTTNDANPFTNICISSEESRADSLTLTVGSLRFYPTMQEKAKVVGPLADYSLEKKIHIRTVDGNGESKDYYFLLSKSTAGQFQASASTIEGYEFIGWYADETLLTKENTLGINLTFENCGMTVTARYQQLPQSYTNKENAVIQVIVEETISIPAETEDQEEETVADDDSDVKQISKSEILEDKEADEPLFTNRPSDEDETEDPEYIEGVLYELWKLNGYSDEPVYYRYSDSYFRDRIDENGNENAYIYDESLSSMSAAATSAALYSSYEKQLPDDEGYLYSSRNIQTLLRELKFEDIYATPTYYIKPSPDEASLVFGHKTVIYDGKPYTLIAMFPRSGSDEAETATDAEIGKEGYNAGFSWVGDQYVFPALQEYIANSEITGDIKLWASGMSRAAALVNYTGGRLDQFIDDGSIVNYLPNVSLEKKNIYFYCFAVPTVAPVEAVYEINDDGSLGERKAEYNHIKNVIQAYDFVMYTINEDWGMSYFGDSVVISMNGEGVLSKEEFQEKIQELGAQYVLMGGLEKEELPDGSLITWDENEELYHYLLNDYRSVYTNENFEDFVSRLLHETAPLIDREFYNTYMEPFIRQLMEVYVFQPDSVKEALIESLKTEPITFIKEASIKTAELFVKGLITKDFSELKYYITHNLNPGSAAAEILLRAIQSADVRYYYDFENHKWDESLKEDDEKMKLVLRGQLTGIYNGVKELLQKAELKDAMFFIDWFQLLKGGTGIIMGSHAVNVYHTWARVLDEATNQVSDIYWQEMNPQDAWGYRMLNLPEEGRYSVYVYDEEDPDTYVLRFKLKDGEYIYGGRPVNTDWYVHVGTGNKGIGNVLYLRAGHSYQVVLYPDEELSVADFSVDEWSYYYYPEIFRPVNTILEDTETTLPFSGIQFNHDRYGREDRLVIHLGALDDYPDHPEVFESGRRFLSASNNGASSALADYTIEKVIQMLALNGLDQSVIYRTEGVLNGSQKWLFEVTAPEQKGYIFDGWYFNDTLINPNIVYSRWFNFDEIGQTIIARYHLIPHPEPKPDPKPAPKDNTNNYISQTETTTTNVSEVVSVRRNLVPNTADSINEWLMTLIGSLIMGIGALFLIVQED